MRVNEFAYENPLDARLDLFLLRSQKGNKVSSSELSWLDGELL
jgi:hypothetical protein